VPLPKGPRLSFAAGLGVGLAAIAIAWFVLGGDPPSVALEDDPGIPPPEYVYLDNARVLAYLSQIEGGLSASEKRTRRVIATRNAGASAGGVEAGGSAESESFVEATVTPTATTSFYRLLDRLGDKDYLAELDASEPPAVFARELGAAAEGSFVRITNCRLRLPTYVQMEQVIDETPGPITAFEAALIAERGTEEEYMAQQAARVQAELDAGKTQVGMVGTGTYALSPAEERRLTRAAERFAAAIPPTARVPLSTCAGVVLPRPRPDLLFPVTLDGLTDERSLMAGPVTVVGKVVRQVRMPEDTYVDRKALAAYSQPVVAIDDALGSDGPMSDELSGDVAVLPPGAVILPVAIYK
jgi:hypothetical protein